MAAPDPKNPDLVFGSQRTGVSLYNRKTGQTADGRSARRRIAAPTSDATSARADHLVAGRLERALLRVERRVEDPIDHGHSWTRISGDLTRQTWAVPASAGKYAQRRHAGSPQGTITALAPSPRDVNVLWAGTDDGNIQVTTDGGVKWTDVTPPQIKPWTRIFNMDAGHFDALHRLRGRQHAAGRRHESALLAHARRRQDLDRDQQRHRAAARCRTPSAKIRARRACSTPSTDTQVWVSFDDGDHWTSLRLNMPAISVRDIQVKDDASCLCSDLVAGTHGRGFWILDDVTPLRQQAERATRAQGPYLFKPATGIRVRFGMNDPTPWPPELPAGENPAAGRAHRLLPARARDRRGEARDS